MGVIGSEEVETVALLQADAIWRGVLDPRKMMSVDGVREGLSIGTLVAVALALSPEAHNPVPPHTTPVCS